MQGNTPIEKVLRIAVRKEKEANQFYLDLVEKVEEPTTRDTLTFLAEEELKHKVFLEKYLAGGFQEGSLRMNEGVDDKLVEYMEGEPEEPADTDGPLTPRKAFLLAAKRESAAYKFYTGLSELHPPGAVRDLLKQMAGEELRHKEKMERLCADTSSP